MDEPKMVLVFRKDLKAKDGSEVPAGKLLAHAGHSACAWLLDRLSDADMDCEGDDTVVYEVRFSREEMLWITGQQTKITLQVADLKELREVEGAALRANLETHAITDAARTVFAEPTVTCLAIGPAWPEDVDPVTGKLKLYK